MIASEFKKILSENFTAERYLQFYAGKLSITPKHLTEIVKEVTGKTAGEWIAELGFGSKSFNAKSVAHD